MIKEIKEGMMTMLHQIKNISEERNFKKILVFNNFFFSDFSQFY